MWLQVSVTSTLKQCGNIMFPTTKERFIWNFKWIWRMQAQQKADWMEFARYSNSFLLISWPRKNLKTPYYRKECGKHSKVSCDYKLLLNLIVFGPKETLYTNDAHKESSKRACQIFFETHSYYYRKVSLYIRLA